MIPMSDEARHALTCALSDADVGQPHSEAAAQIIDLLRERGLIIVKTTDLSSLRNSALQIVSDLKGMQE